MSNFAKFGALKLDVFFQIDKEKCKKCYFEGNFWRILIKNGSLSTSFNYFLIVFDENCVTLHRRAYAVPSEKDARMGGTLHNVKASSMLCLLAV